MSTLFILSLAVVCAVLGVCLGLVVAACLVATHSDSWTGRAER